MYVYGFFVIAHAVNQVTQEVGFFKFALEV